MAGEVLQHIWLLRKTNVVESVKNKEINTNVLQDMHRLVYASAVARIALGMSSQQENETLQVSDSNVLTL